MQRSTDRKLLQSDLTLLSVFMLHLFLTHSCRGSCEDQPIIALAGEDVILPCHIEPPASASSRVVLWTKPGLNPKYVHVQNGRQPVYRGQNASYRNRTALFADKLENGNVSLKLFNVKISDAGKYFCILESVQKKVSIQLTVGAVSSPITRIVSNNSSVVLQCESEGWYPEPEVSWLDGEGHVLSAGPTETVRGPDGLYTVSSRVTVEKRHNNNFTCRVQQKDINQTRETQIHVPDDFFELQSSSSAVTDGFVVSLSVCILIIPLFVFSFCWRQKRNKNKRNYREKTDESEMNGSITKTGEEKESKLLTTEGTERKRVSKKGKERKRRKYPCEALMKTDQVKIQNSQNFKEEKPLQQNEPETKNKEQDESKCEMLVNLQRDDTNSASQSSTTGPDVEVDRVEQIHSSQEDVQRAAAFLPLT